MRARMPVAAGGLVMAGGLALALVGGGPAGAAHRAGPAAATSGAQAARQGAGAAATPIEHVVVLFQENHSFDEFLGGLCLRDKRCNARSSGKVSTGQIVPLHAAPDIAPEISHTSKGQTTAIDGGLMDHFDLISGCGASTGYACYEQYTPAQIPNLAALARAFVISDRTFEGGRAASFGGHFVLAAAQLDGFTG